jgi:hypothetical protein
MAAQKNHSNSPAASESSRGPEGYLKQNAFARFMRQIYSLNSLCFFAGFCQLLLGIIVVIISAAGLIHPLWISTVLSIAASIATMTGIYFCYSFITEQSRDTLLRDAMRRIVEEQN